MTSRVDARKCCSCGGAYPVSLVTREACLHDTRVNHPAPAHCRPESCAGVKCKPCPGQGPKASCTAGNPKGINICTPFVFY